MNNQTSAFTPEIRQNEDAPGEPLQFQTRSKGKGSAGAAYNRLWRDIISDNSDRTESSEDLKAQRPPQDGECFATISELRARYSARLDARRVAA